MEKITSPKVTVLMSVKDREKYLRGAMDSILSQTFTDFEFVIIDDGSTDRTAEILDGYTDPRIVRIKNEKNIGISASVNKGIEIARGDYIARMDSDDISLPQRLEIQVAYLQDHPEVTAVFSRVVLFSDMGKVERWVDDEENITNEQIRESLPRVCCVANPTALIRAHVLKKYQYDTEQFLSEDWDLWLRLISDGHCLEKIDQQLLRYRIHDLSETQMSFINDGLKRKIYDCRNRFLKKQVGLGKWGEVEKQVFYHHVIFLLRSFSLSEALSLFPNCFRLSPSGTISGLVINFRKINEGGVERVITTWANEFSKFGYAVTLLTDEAPSLNDYPLSPSIRRITIPPNDDYLEKLYEFVENGCPITYIINDDYSELGYRKMLLLKILGMRVIVANHGVWHVPAHPSSIWNVSWKFRPLVFGFMDAVVCLSLVDKAYWDWSGLKNVLYIHNPPPFEVSADGRSLLEQPLIIWVGRFSEEKHPELMIEIFAQVRQHAPNAMLCMLGDGALLEKCKEMARRMGVFNVVSFPGFVNDVQNYLRRASVHCITSEYEGFPMSWLEAKACGVPTVLFRLRHLEMSVVPGSVSIKRYDTASFADQVARLLNDDPARKEMGEQAFLSLSEFSGKKAFERWEQLFRFLSSQGNSSCDMFGEECPPERLKETLFDQTTQLLNDWMEYSLTKTLESQKIKRLSRQLLNVVMQKIRIFLKKFIGNILRL